MVPNDLLPPYVPFVSWESADLLDVVTGFLLNSLQNHKIVSFSLPHRNTEAQGVNHLSVS